jgi:hypothetical protein
MKTNVAKSIFLSIAIFSLTAGIPAGNVSAQSPAIQQSAEPAADIRYAGTNNEFFKFEVNFRQPADQKSVLRVLDENGSELYRETVSEREFSKTIKVSCKADVIKLHFIVSGTGTNFSKSFSIRTEVPENYLVSETSN